MVVGAITLTLLASLFGFVAPVAAASFVVNSTADTPDATSNGICATAAGVCTLRAAVQEANSSPGADVVTFNIPGTGIQTIALGSRIDVTGAGGVTIDGYSQPGSSPNTDPLASNAVIRIAITGPGDSVEVPGLFITSSGNTIRGLSMYQLWRKIWLAGPNAANNLIAGNFIGTNPAGTFASPDFVDSAGGGILVDSGAHDNRIGETTLAGRNVISGNQRSGINITQVATARNIVRNNIIGLSPDGTRDLGNLTHGIDHDQGPNDSVIGGTGSLERNVISGNGNSGVELAHVTQTLRNQIIGNFIGTDLTGQAGPGYARNGGTGILVEDGPSENVITDNVIGNNGAGGIVIAGQLTRDNVIARNLVGVSLSGAAIPNSGNGIEVTFHPVRTTIGPGNIVANQVNGISIGPENDVDGNRITQNSIFDNSGMGIEILPSGINPNGHHPVNGPNQAAPFPTLASATTTTVTGRACASCTVEIFKADGGAGEFGSGVTFAGTATASAAGVFTATVTGLAIGDYVTGTATDANGNTSEFSLNRPVTTSGVSDPGTLIAQDNFNRTLTDAWGTPQAGGPYTLLASQSKVDYDVNGSFGTISMVGGPTRGVTLSSIAERDIDLTVQVRTDKVAAGGNQHIYVPVRIQGTSEYRVIVRLAVGGGVFVQGSQVVGGESGIGAEVRITGLVHTANQPIWVRARVTGANPTTIRIKAWADGSLQPSAWNYTATNSNAALQTAGGIGFRSYIGGATNAPVLVGFDELRAVVAGPEDTTPPAAPQNLIGAPGSNAAALNWNAGPEPDIAGYHVYRSLVTPVPTTGTPLSGTAPVPGTSYFDATAVNGTTYNYVVTTADTSANRSGPSNTVTVTPDLTAGSALDFDGTNDHVTLGGQSAFNSNTFTIETWFRRDGTGVATGTSATAPGLVSVIPLVTKGRTGGTAQIVNWFLGIDTATNRIAADFETAADDVNHGIFGTTTLVNGTWYHAAATYDETTFRLYLNGSLEASAAVAAGPGAGSTHPAALGTALDTTGATGGFFNGALDEVRIWNVARSSAQIAAGRGQQLNSGSGLVGRFGLNDGTGTQVANSVAGGSTGTTVGGPIWITPGAPFIGAGDLPPAAPTGLIGTPGPGRADLTWNANSEPDLAGYNVYRNSVLTGASVQAVAAGDIASCSSTGDEATAALLDTIPGTVFALGDNVYESGTTAEWTNCYNPTWGRAKARTSPTSGNHEYQSGNANGYYTYFGAAAGNPSQGYYSYDYGTWHVIVLNSNCANVACAVGSAQEQWLRADLAATSEVCTIAYFHHPRFSSGDSHGNDSSVAPFWDALYEGNADVILTGHDHTYERFAPQTPGAVADPARGIRQFVVGTGGRSHNGFDNIEPNSQVRNGDTYGVLKLNLNAGSYNWQFMPEAGRTFTDSGTASCHDANGLVSDSGAPLNGDTPIPSPSYTDTNVVAGTNYSYTVTAVDAVGQESPNSASVNVTPTAPTNNGLDFDGTNDHATLGAAAALNSNIFTVETWFRRDGTGVSTATSATAPGLLSVIPLVTKGRTGGTGGVINWFLGIDTATNRIAADYESADDTNHGLIGTTTLVNGTWYHAAGTYDGSTFRLYLNGALEASVAATAGPGTASTHPAALGTALDASAIPVPAGFFNGVLDEIRVWNVARTGAQIAANRPLQVTSGTGLTARWGLNEGAGTTLANSVAGAPTGTAVGGPVWTGGFVVTDIAPAPPTGLTASPGNNSVVLSWAANGEPDLAGYRVYRGTSTPVSTAGAPLSGGTLLTSTAYTDPTALNGTTYFYVVTAVDAAGQASAASATVSATPSATAGSALDFDGTNDHVTLGPATGLNSNTFTIETWFRRDGTGVMAATTSGAGGVSAAPLIAKGLSGGGTINYFMGITATGMLAADFESAVDDSNHGITGTTTIVNGIWHHAAATYDGTTLRLYLDGVQEASIGVTDGPGTASSHPPSLATALTPAGVATGFFNGVLDEARIWNVARTAAEINAARTLELTSGTGLMARYGLNEGSGTALGNSIGGGPAGIAVNGPTWTAGAPFGGGPVDPPPAAPTGLVANPGNSSVTLSWTANTEPDLAGYRVYRGTSSPVSTAGSPLSGGTLLTSLAYTDNTAVNGTPYFYVVTAVDAAGGASSASNQASATPSSGDLPPAAPTGLVATPGNNQVALNWNANTEPDLAGYNVYRDGGPTGPTVQAVGAGDIASCSSTGDEATAALLATISGDVLALGDTVYESGTPTEYTNCYNPSWGAQKTRTRPVVGNHEYGTANASGYFGYFGAAAGPVGQGWYSYDYGTWHVIVLNSMCANVGGCGTGSAQLNWLQLDLAANNADCTMALWHHPRFSSAANHGSDPVTQPLYQALYDANADLILTGHDHSYERFAPQTATGALDNVRGIRQFVVGTGGRSHYSQGTLRPNSQIYNGDTYGVIKLQLKPTGYDWEFVPEAGKTFTDTGSDVCHDASGPITDSAPLNGGTPLATPSFTDTTAVNGTTYDYVVTAVDDIDQESGPSASVSATPVAGSALDFDGTDDHVTFGAATAELGVTDFTIETWFRRDGAGLTTSTGSGGVTTAIPLVTKGRTENDTPLNINANYFLGIDATTGVLVADFEDNATGGNHPVTGITAIPISATWHHAAVTYNTTTDTWNLYLDGNLERNLGAGGDFTPNSVSIQHAALGTAINSTGVTAGFFDGALDEARIWNVARTQAQIQATRDQQLTSGPGLTARYGLNEGSGTSAASSVAGAPTGTLVNGPLWVPGAPFGGGNQAPVFSTDITDQSNTEGQAVSLDADATDPDLDTLTYSATGLPNGVTINSSTGVISGTLSGTSSGVHSVVITVSDGTLTDTDPFTWTVAEPGGGATGIDFDGTNDHVTLGPASTFNNNTFTIETWFRRDGTGVATGTSGSAPGLISVIPLVTKGRTGGTAQIVNWFLGIDTATNRIAADFETAADDVNHGLFGTTTLVTGTWYHAAATYDGTTFRVYLNGVQENSVAVAGGPGAGSTHPAALGTALDAAAVPVAAGFFNGVLDEVRIWSTSRSAAEISAGMSQQLTSGTGLTARYGLNEGSGTSAASSVAGAPTGTLVNGPLWVPGAPFGGGNQAPVFSTDITDQSNTEGQAVSLDADATDPDLDTLTYSATGLPNGVTINSSTGVISGTLSGTSSGVHSVVITVSDGTLTDTDPFTWTVAEPGGGATGIDFDGTNDHVTLGPASTFNNNTFTIETWFRRDGTGVATGTSGSAPGLISVIPLVTKGRTGGTAQIVNWFLGIDTATNRIAADFETAADDVNHGLFGTTTLVTGTWYHAAATYDGTTFRVYLNGVQENSVAVAGGPGAGSTHPAALGTALDAAAVPVAAGFFNGVLDEVRIWSTSRSAAEISAGMSQQLTSGTGLTARYGLNEGSGTSAASSVAGAPTGTLVNGPLWVPGAPFGGGNQAPVFSTDITDQSNTEGQAVSLDADATDPDLDTLTYSATGLPNGVTINSSTGVISGTLSLSSAGVHSVVVTVSDGSLTDIDGFTWTVVNANQAPVFSTDITDQSNTEGQAVSLDADATDPDLDTLTYSATGLPNGVTINSSTGVISGTLSGTSSGVHSVVITVSDGGLTDTDGFTWTVADVGAANSGLDFDGTNDHVTLGPAATFNDNTFTVETWFRRDGTGVPTLTSGTAPGLLSVIPLVTKGRSGGTGGVINWFLGIDTATNRIAADFESADDTNHGIMGTTTLVTGTWYHAAITYSGSNFRLYLNGIEENFVAVAAGPGTGSTHPPALGTALDASAVPVPAGFFNGVLDEVRIWDSNRSAADILANKNLELTSGTGLVARYGLNEGSGTSAASSVAGAPTGTLVNGPLWVPGFVVPGGNQAPVFSTDITDQSNTEGNVVSLDADATDPDVGDTLTYSATGLPNGVSINSSTGVISGTLSGTSSGVHSIVVTVSDGGLTDTDGFTWTVADVGAANSGLDFDGTNDHVTLGPAATFNDNTFTVETWFRRDGTGVPTLTSGTAPGLLSVIPLVTKGRSGGTGGVINWFLGIDTATNRIAADFESADDTNHGIMGTTTLVTGTWYHAAITYSGSNFRLYLNGIEENFVAVAAGPGTGSTHPPALGTALDASAVPVPAGFFNGVLDEVRIWDSNRSAADILANKNLELTSGTGLVARYGLNEGSGTSAASSVAGAPTGTLVNGPLWVPGFVVPGGNQAPVFSTDITDQSNTEGNVVSLDADATDPDVGDTLTYSATGLPGGISINSSTGVISGTLSLSSAGVHSVVITVSDGTATDTDPFTWTVVNANQAPVFSTDITDQSNTEGQAVSLDADATDPDLDTLTYSATGLPNGVTINSSTGVISGTLSPTSSGVHSVVITVSDGGLTDTDGFTWTVADVGAANSGLDFDGTNDHVTLGPAATFNDNTFTVETWFRRDGTGVPTLTSGTAPGLLSVIPLVTKGRSGGTGGVINWFLGIDTATNRIAADFESADDTNHGIMGTTTLVTGTWYHAAITYSGSNFRLYLNGIEENFVAVAAGPGTGSTHPPALGTALDASAVPVPAGFFNGVLDEVRIWDSNRSAADILANKNLELTSGTGLVARYGLNEGSGTSAASSVAGAPTGTLVNGPLWVPGFVVPGGNQAPVFSTDITDQSNTEGNVVSLDADATDPDVGDTLTYSATGLPGGISINSSTGVISGTLSLSSAGVHSVVITVSDGTDTDTDPFTWTVVNANQAPVFSTDITDQSNTEGQAVSLDADATDPDLDTLTYSATGLPNGVTINGSTGVISGTLSLSSAGVHSVVITVSDGIDTDTDGFSWTVANLNQAPVFSTDITDQSNTEGNAVSLDADATDPDLDTLVYSATGLPGGISINSSTGVISGTLSPTSAGVHSVVITVSDGSLTDTDSLTWTVANANQAPVFSTDITNQSNTEGNTVSLDADATDPDLDTLVYSATGLPSGVTINSSTGVISGTLSLTSAGVHSVVITVSDGSLTDTDPFTWTVSNLNQAPVFSTDITNQSNTEGNTVSLDADATDADLDTLVYSATGLPNGVTINSSTGVISGTLSASSSGVHSVVITVSDSIDTDTDPFTWTVADANQAPVFSTDITNQSNTEGQAVSLDADATDADLDTLVYSATGLPGGISINSSTGVISGTLSLSSAGVHTVVITVSDGGLTDTDGFTWTVANANQAPVFSTDITDQSNTEGQAVSLDADATDADLDTLTYSATGLPNGVTINASTGVISGTLSLSSAGVHSVVVTVSDGGLTDTDPFTWTVANLNQAPTATVSLSPASPTTNATLTATATKNDADANPVSLTFVWKVNGTTVRTFTSPTALVDTLNLSVAGNGDPGQVVSVEVTPNDGTLNGTMVSASVTVASSLVTYASDTFTRTVVNNWGSATPTGGAYTLSGTAADFDVTGTTGTIALTAPGANRLASLAAVSAQDVELSFRFTTNKIPAGGNQFIYGVARRINATNAYRIIVRIATNGQVFIQASQVLANVETGISSEVLVPGLTHTPGSFIRVRAQLSGTNPTTIRARAWAEAGTEPATWQYTGTNSAAALQAAGGVGVRAYMSGSTTNAPVIVTFDDLLVTSIGAPANTAPTATVSLSPASPTTNATLTATATKNDADANPVSLTFVWKVNGTTVRTFTSPTALVDTLNLSVAGNGDPGQVVSVEVTPNDGTLNGTMVSASVTVAGSNTAPVIDTVTISPSSPTTNQTLTASVTSHDAEGGTLTNSYQWTRNGTDIAGATSATLNLATAGNGDTGDLIRVRVTVSDGSLSSAPVTSSPVTVVNTAPTATVGLSPASPTTNATLTATATKNDADANPVSLTFVWKVNGTTVRTFTSPTALVDTLNLSVAGNGDPGQVVSVEVTPNDGTLNGTMVSASVTVASSLVTYASDTFTRTVVNNWGSATPTGGAYTLSGTAANYDVTGSAGTIANAAGVSRSCVLGIVSAQDVDLSFRFATDRLTVGGNQFIYGVARRVSSTTYYRVIVRIATTGQVFLQASAVVSGVETGIGSEVLVAGLTFTPGSFIRVRAQLSGTNATTIQARAWADAGTEPATWTYTGNNSAAALQVAGAVGLQTYVSSAVTNGPVLATFDDFLVTSIAP